MIQTSPYLQPYQTVPKEQLFIDSLQLAPGDFFLKKMTISVEALRNIFILWERAIINFLNCNYLAYDALVGENACQIRAFLLMRIIATKNDDKSFNECLHMISKEIKKIIESMHDLYVCDEDVKNSILDFIMKNNLFFHFKKNFYNYIKYIIDAFVLTLVKEKKASPGLILHERTNYKYIQDLGFTCNQAKYIVKKAQSALSEASCIYVKDEASLLGNNALCFLMRIRIDERDRSYLPQFFVAKILFLRAIQENYFILLTVTRLLNNSYIDQISLYFKPCLEKKDFVICSNISENKACIALSGIVNYDDSIEPMGTYRKRLLSVSLLDVILANFASHPQYANEFKNSPPLIKESIDAMVFYMDTKALWSNKEDILIAKNNIEQEILYEKKVYEQYKQLAIKTGCSIENPALLFLRHVCCDKIKNPMNSLELLAEEPKLMAFMEES